MHGQGTYLLSDGRVYMGQYSFDLKHGEGMYLWADGTAYNGQWDNGKQNGTGFYIEKLSNKHDQNYILKIRKGKWDKGKRISWEDN